MRITSAAAALLLSAVTIFRASAAAEETPAVVRRLLPSDNGYERVEIKTGEAFWKKVEAISGLGSISVKEKTLTVFRRRDDDNVRETAKRRHGDGAVIFTVARGMHGPVYMAVAVGREKSEKGDGAGIFRVLGAEILKHDEVGGARAMEDDFLAKFRGRGLDGFSARGAKADSVSGATISSGAVAEGIKKALAIAEYRFKMIE